MSGQLPTARLDELVDLQTEKVVTNKDPELPYVGLEHIAQGEPRLLGWQESVASTSTNNAFQQDDILFGKLRPNLRKSVRAPFEGYCSTDILVLRPRRGVCPSFAGHVFQSVPVFAAAVATAAGTKMPRTSWHDLRGLRVFTPTSEPAQRRIAAVLDTVDEAIAKTEAVIAKLRQVRAGLLHDLLTRGLDENGELRDPVARPEEFWDSPVGRIPRGWEVKALRECLTENPQNGIYKPASQIGRGTLLVGQTSFAEDRTVDFELARRAVVSQTEIQHFGLQPGDLLVSRVFATVEGVGRPAMVPTMPEPAVYESNMMRLRVRREVITPQLVFHWLQSAAVRSRILAAANSSNQTSINQQGVNSLPIGVPEPGEQERTLPLLTAYEAREKSEEANLQKLQLLKSGLLSDLLTGRVRVPEGVGAVEVRL